MGVREEQVGKWAKKILLSTTYLPPSSETP
jgi:hypothetical protein